MVGYYNQSFEAFDYKGILSTQFNDGNYRRSYSGMTNDNRAENNTRSYNAGLYNEIGYKLGKFRPFAMLDYRLNINKGQEEMDGSTIYLFDYNTNTDNIIYAGLGAEYELLSKADKSNLKLFARASYKSDISGDNKYNLDAFVGGGQIQSGDVNTDVNDDVINLGLSLEVSAPGVQMGLSYDYTDYDSNGDHAIMANLNWKF